MAINISNAMNVMSAAVFDSDLDRMQFKLGLKSCYVANDEPISRHSNDYSDVPVLSHKAIKNLEQWYVQDIEFYKTCELWIEETMY